MNFKTVLLLSIFATLKPLESKAMKRIKRNTEVKAQNDELNHDFVTLHNEKNNPIEMGQKDDSKVLDTRVNHNFTKKPFLLKKHNHSKPLTVILREREHKLNSRHMEEPERRTAHSNTEYILGRSCNAHRDSKERFKAHKNKRVPHILHSAGVVEAKVLIPPHPVAVSPLASFEQLIGNMMMFEVGMDSLPSHPSEITITSNSPYITEKRKFYQPNDDPSLDYIYNSIDEPHFNYMNLKTPLQLTSPIMEDNLKTHTLFYKPPASHKEPTPLANFMQTALDTMLANSDGVDGGKNDGEIELRCPVHYAKNGADNGDAIQVCSCRFIKKTNEDESKELK